MANLTLVQAINLALTQEMEEDDRVLVLGEDVGVNGGVFRVTEGLHKRFGPDRVVDTPLAESGIIGTAIGLAIGGLRPVPEIQFEGFLGPAYDQICTHAARMRSRTRGSLTVPLTIRVPIGGGIHAPELHSDSPEAVFARLGKYAGEEDQAAAGIELAAEQVRWVRDKGWAGLYLMSPSVHRPVLDVLRQGLG